MASKFHFHHTCLIHIFCLCFVHHTEETGTPIQETTADVCDVKKEINWQNTFPEQCSRMFITHCSQQHFKIKVVNL